MYSVGTFIDCDIFKASDVNNDLGITSEDLGFKVKVKAKDFEFK